MADLIEIDVDNLSVLVDTAEYEKDPQAVVETVRARRRAVRLGQDPLEANEILGHNG